MKKRWEEPMILVQQFVANEYVAACGDENKVYNFTCDAARGRLFYYPQSDGTIDGIYTGTGKAKEIGNYHPCGETHEASVTNDFYDGFVRTGTWLTGYKDNPVIVWRGPDNNNGHATENLDMSSWTTAKS